LEGLEQALRVEGFLTPRQAIKIPDSRTECDPSGLDLQDLMPYIVGAIQVDSSKSLAELELALRVRLSFSWISSCPISERRIAWIRSYEDLESGRRIWEAARALGIAVVILDNEGNWAQKDDDRWNHLREAFIPTDITGGEGFVERILAAVRSYDKPIDALVTCYNPGLLGAAQACEELGFHSAPSESYIIAGDKFRTRELEPHVDGTFMLSTLEDLHLRLSSSTQPPINYPLIVKPCNGWGSECVSKVQNEEQLVQAVSRVTNRHITGPYPRTDVMVEPYINGPEIDANFVLLDGEIAFCEMADDFPKVGDATENASFLETSMVLPTGLSSKEIRIAKDSIHRSLLKQGFLTGVFHCEGRIRYSSKKYDTRDGLVDLQSIEAHADQEPEFYLHEINVRPGGYFVSSATLLTYGVDYYACHMLLALGDHDRCRALSVPFSNGPQWWMEVVIIQEDKTGVMKTPDAGKEMLERHPDLRFAVADYKTHRRKGDKLYGPHAALFTYLAYFLVVSRESRTGCLRLAEKVRRSFKYEIE
jgi:biotin carboxylase